MLTYPQINPVALDLGIIQVHWYGIMYMIGFLFFVLMGKWRLKKYPSPFWTNQLIDDFIFYGALGVVLGGRIGYCLFYKPMYYLNNPLDILKIYTCGMSFHGGMLGVFIVAYIFAKKYRQSFFMITDFVAPLIPMGLLLGRIGNFINGELWGRLTASNIPWGMVYSQSGVLLPRHPSQIYEALGEGFILFIILWVYTLKPRKLGTTSGVFLLSYGCIRFFLEYFREPDSFLSDFVTRTGLSMGQWLCVPMIIIGILIYIFKSQNSLKCKNN